MSRFKKANAKSVTKVLRAFADYLDGDSNEPECRKFAAAKVNDMLDELLGEDFFGTEGQCDPRGDHRD